MTELNQPVHAGFRCPTCGSLRPRNQEVQVSSLDPHLLSLLRSHFPGWEGETTCRADVRRCRVQALRDLLEAERGEVGPLDEEVLARMADSQTVAHQVQGDPTALGDRVADAVARFGGSWKFIGLFSAVLLAWMLLNVSMLGRAFDPYPFILLNLVLSSLAALQAPVIMMSQNRSAERDRLRAEHDYQVNLKAELEIRLLNDKLDRLLLHDWPRLVELQELQMDLLEDLSERQSEPDVHP